MERDIPDKARFNPLIIASSIQRIRSCGSRSIRSRGFNPLIIASSIQRSWELAGQGYVVPQVSIR